MRSYISALALGTIVGVLLFSSNAFAQFADELLSIDLAPSPQSGYILSTDGTDNVWIANTGGGGGGSESLWALNTSQNYVYSDSASTTATTSARSYYFTATSTTDNSVFPRYTATYGTTTYASGTSLTLGGNAWLSLASSTALTATRIFNTNGTSTNWQVTTLGVGTDYLTDLTGTGLQNSSGVLTLNATGDWTGTLDGFEGATLAQTNWLYNGSRLSPSTTVGIGVFASSTISALSSTISTSTSASSTNFFSTTGTLTNLFFTSGIGTSATITNATSTTFFTTTASGSTMYGFGLTDCDADNQTVAYDVTTGKWSCGDDDTGGAGTSVQTFSYIVDADGGGDFTTIQGALDQCATDGGGSIYLSDPYYFIGGTGLVFKSNDCQVYGIYASTTIEISGATTAFKTNSPAGTYANVGVHNVIIVGDGTAGSVGINMSDMIRAHYFGIIMDNIDYGFVLNDTQNVSFYNTVRDFVITTVGSAGIYASSTNPTNDNKFSDGFIGCTASCTGIHLNNAQANSFTNVSIEPGTTNGTIGVKIEVSNSATNNGTFANKFTNLYAEANGIGIISSSTVGTKPVLANSFDGGEIVANTVDVIDGSNGGGALHFNGAIVNYEVFNRFATTSIRALLATSTQTVTASSTNFFASLGTFTNAVINTLLTAVNATITGVLTIPNGTGPTADDPGELAWDTSDDQAIIDDRVIRTKQELYSFSIASTSPYFVSGTVKYLPIKEDGFVVSDLWCFTEGGTSKAITLFGESLTCDADGTADDGSIAIATVASASTTAGGGITAGATTGTVNAVNITITGRYTRE